RLPLRLASGRVAAQSEHVLDARLADLVEDLAQTLHGLSDAAEMRHRLDPELLLDPLRDLDRARTGRTPRAVRDRHERGRQVSKQGQRFAERGLALGRLGREELEGEDGLAGALHDLVDAHGRWIL